MKRKITSTAVALLLAGGVTFALAGPTQAGQNANLTVAKVVTGPANPAATYVVNYLCAGSQSVNINLNFDAAGQPNPQTASGLFNGFIGTCTVTETNTGGAVHVTYACVINNPPQTNATCSGGGASPAVITFTSPGSAAGSIGTVTITNDFTPDPVVSAPRLTG